MKNGIRLFCHFSLLFLLACSGPVPMDRQPGNAHERLQKLFEDYQSAYNELNPINATLEGDYRFNDVFGDYLSAEYLHRSEQLERKYLRRLKSFDYENLDEEDRTSYDIFEYDRHINLEAYTQGYARMETLLPVSQFFSMPNLTAQLGSGASIQPFKTVTDYENWLKRAAGFAKWVDRAIDNMHRGMREGIVQPRIIIEKALPQLQSQLVNDVHESIFYRPTKDLPDSFDKTDANRLDRLYTGAIKDVIIPAYRRLYNFLHDEYLPHTRDTIGLSALPGGRQWYTYLVRRNTTTQMTPQQIHAIGEDEAKRIYTEMQSVKKRTGYSGSLQDFFTYMKTDPRFKYGSKEELLTSFQDVKRRVEAALPGLFSLMPGAKFVIRQTEPFRAASAAAAEYVPPAPDGSRPGTFYVNTYDLPSRYTWQRDFLFLHEAEPGHHFQIAIAQEQTSLPPFRRFDGPTSFIEGWGLYAESLGDKLGLYTDPYQKMGALTAEIWRANRLVVDTGIHALGWTRQQAIDWMASNSPMSKTDIVAEVDRYIAIPGQALAYKIGQMKFIQLRELARTKLGARFDIRAFHREVLAGGAMPLNILERRIRSWILNSAKQK